MCEPTYFHNVSIRSLGWESVNLNFVKSTEKCEKTHTLPITQAAAADRTHSTIVSLGRSLDC